MRRAMTALLVVCVGCARGSAMRPAGAPAIRIATTDATSVPGDPWKRHERSSAKTLEIAALTLATGVTASAFGGGLAGTGAAVGPPSGEPPLWIGVGTLIVGITATTVGLVVLAVAGVQYASGD